ncbi:MAG: GTP-binding protein [Candidatus Ryanbacteria bacterium]|nr:GTP-binding protein [Candidatus Ryanbacteria bacterium]
MDTTHNNPTEKQTRPPVVVVLGHVDHGKTTLLDKIRSTDVAAREAGGITQHLGAYQIEWQKKPITFLDTPGHETFSKMRSRGAAVADVAILVVAADDGPRLQTVEALSAIQSGKIPFVVALNKVDKPTADIDRAKAKLAEIGVLLEGWGGTVPVVALSAKEGRGIDELLETVFLLAELAELSYNPAAAGEGVVIESHLDSKRGPAATLLIRDGVLRRGAFVQAGTALAPVRIMEGTDGNALDEASASMPVVIAGFSEVPLVGVQFALFSTKREAEERAEASRAAAGMQGKSFGKAEIGVMIKADVA